MKLTNATFKDTIRFLNEAYIDWKLTEEQMSTWRQILTLDMADEILPKVALNWARKMTTAPRNPAEILKYAQKMIIEKYDSEYVAANIVFDAVKGANWSEDFSNFYHHFIDRDEDAPCEVIQEEYIVNYIRKHSSSPEILASVYDEFKGALGNCTDNDESFIRNSIQKRWKEKVTETADCYVRTGNPNMLKLTNFTIELLEAKKHD